MTYIPTDTDCSELNPGMCGGKMQPTMLDNCDNMYFEGVDDVTINQGVGIDLDDGVTAYDSTGMEIPFEHEPTEIDKCSVGEHEVIYKAIGADERLLPSICGENFLSMACSGIGTLIAKRLVTIEQADPPTINGIGEPTILSVDEPFDPMNGVTGVDDNGNPVDVTYSGKLADSAEGDIASFETDLTAPLRSLKVNLEPIQYCTPWIGTEINRTPYLNRAMPSQGNNYNRESLKIVGGTVAWNQLVGSGSWYSNTINGVTVSSDGNTGTITVSGIATDFVQFSFTYPQAYLLEEHVYYLAQPNGANGSTYYIRTGESTFWSYKYIGKVATTSNLASGGIRVVVQSGQTVNFSFRPQLFDLTQMFGSTIADYIYSLEQANEGAGVAWFRKLFPNDYYEYNAGELLSVKGLESHDTVGFNQWDEDWEIGTINFTTGEPTYANDRIRAKNFNPCLPNKGYYLKDPSNDNNIRLAYYDADKNFVGESGWSANQVRFTPNNAYYFKFIMGASYGTTYNHDICINLSKTTGTPKNGDYVAYVKHSYPLDSSLTLRGIPKLDASNNLYYDGDIYASDGAVTRRFIEVTYDGSESWYSVSSGYDANTNRAMKLQVIPLQSGYSWNLIGSYVSPTGSAYSTPPLWTANFNPNGALIIGIPSTITTIAEWQAYLAQHPLTLVYEATPTTETADPYTNPQIVDPSGTEEFVTSNFVPVGQESRYSLVCPIYGHDSVGANVTGVNVWDEEWELGYYNVTTGEPATSSQNLRSKNYISVVPNTSYYVKTPTGYIAICEYDADKNFIKCTQGIVNSGITTTANTHFIRFHCTSAYGTTYNHDISINYPSTDHDYHAYNGTTYPVSWQTEAGTVYGGTVDLVTGVLTVDKVSIDLTQGMSGGTISGNYLYLVVVPNAKTVPNSQIANVISEGYEAIRYNGVSTNVGTIAIRDNHYLYVNTGSQDITPTGKAVYELATPQTYQLTPQQIQTLYGRNNVWSEDGDVYVEFWKSIPQGEFSYPLDGVYSIFYHAEDECGNQSDVARTIDVDDATTT